MIRDKDRILLKRYRHIIAALIAYSIGYFTPLVTLHNVQSDLQIRRHLRF